jgi:SAM-dependent methyltransferase
MTTTRKLDVGIDGVNDVYDGPGGTLWEMLMGEQIHVGGATETDILAQKAGITASSVVLDVCSALGGPARHLARKFGCRVVGLDATPTMHGEAERRNREAGLEGKVTCKLGNALDMPFRAGSFDVVWGQDAWCYVTDKARLVAECARVVRPGGVVAFTDWLETGPMSDERWAALNGFMVFPYLETLDGYVKLAEMAGLQVSEREDLSPDFARHIQGYYDALTNGHRAAIVAAYGEDLYEGVKQGLTMWRDASAAGEVGRGRIVARKPS